MKFPGRPKFANWDYEIKFEGMVDKKDWIASLTSLNGMFGGSTGPFNHGLDPATQKYEKGNIAAEKWIKLQLLLRLLDNFRNIEMTSNRISENIKDVIQVKSGNEKEHLLHLDYQNHLWLNDQFPET